MKTILFSFLQLALILPPIANATPREIPADDPPAEGGNPPTVLKVGVVLVNWSNYTLLQSLAGYSFSESDVANAVYGAPGTNYSSAAGYGNVAGFYWQNSYNQVLIQGLAGNGVLGNGTSGDVYYYLNFTTTPHNQPLSSDPITGCSAIPVSAWRSWAQSEAIAHGIPVQSYDRMIYIFPHSCDAETAAAYYFNRFPSLSSNPPSIVMNGWNGGSYRAAQILSHEIGHSLAVQHANSINCGATALSTTCNDSTNNVEYGDPWETMANSNLVDFNADRKVRMGWIPAFDVVTLSTPGVYPITLKAQDINSYGTRALRIQSALFAPKIYSVEYRQRRPIQQDDPTNPGNATDPKYVNMVEGAILRLTDLGLGSVKSWLLNVNGSDTPSLNQVTNSRFTDGQSWSFPLDHITITQVSHNGTEVNLVVTISP